MSKLMLKTLFALLLVVSFSNVYAQDNNDTDSDAHNVSMVVPNFAILDVEPENTDITLTFAEPTEAGTALQAVTNDDLWLNYSSIVASGETRKVTVALDNNAPSGLVLKVTADAQAGGVGKGTMGTPTATVTLTNTAQDVVTGIGSCYTGDGNTNGHKLNYELSADDNAYGNIESGTTTLSVTYTIVAN